MITRNYRPTFQMGGPQETPMMEQQEQPGQEQDQEQQIMQMVAQALQQGIPPEKIMQMLVQQGIPQEQAQQIIQEVMSQMQGQMSQQQPTNDMQQAQPMMQKGGPMPNFKPKYNMQGSDRSDSTAYKRDFYQTPFLAMTPSRLAATPANYGWGDYKNHKYDTDLDWQLKQGNPYVMYTSDNPDVRRAAANESAAYNDYKNQLLQYIKTNPKAKKQVERLTGFKFQNGGSNGYDAINPSMYNQMQGLYNQNMVQRPMTQEEMSRKGSMMDEMYVNKLAKQNMNIAKQLLPGNMFQYAQKNLMTNPYVQQYVDPTYMLKNQSYKEGGRTVSEASTDYDEYSRVMKSIQRAKVPTFNKNTDFGTAFKKARQAGASTFLHNGKLYTTEMADTKSTFQTPSMNNGITEKVLTPTKNNNVVNTKNYPVTPNLNLKADTQSNLGRNIAIGTGAAGMLGAGAIGYMGYNHPELLKKYMPRVYHELPDYHPWDSKIRGTDKPMLRPKKGKELNTLDKIERKISKVVDNLANKYENHFYPDGRPLVVYRGKTINQGKGVFFPKLNNIPEKVGSKLYQYPKLKPYVNYADDIYKQTGKTISKIIKRIK